MYVKKRSMEVEDRPTLKSMLLEDLLKEEYQIESELALEFILRPQGISVDDRIGDILEMDCKLIKPHLNM